MIFDGEVNGAGIVPYHYKADNFYNAMQWAAGLELFLLIADPAQVYFTTDHPNGAPYHDLSGPLRAHHEPRSAQQVDGRSAEGSD